MILSAAALAVLIAASGPSDDGWLYQYGENSGYYLLNINPDGSYTCGDQDWDVAARAPIHDRFWPYALEAAAKAGCLKGLQS